jgi:predicted Zn-dependent peptidase
VAKIKTAGIALAGISLAVAALAACLLVSSCASRPASQAAVASPAPAIAAPPATPSPPEPERTAASAASPAPGPATAKDQAADRGQDLPDRNRLAKERVDYYLDAALSDYWRESLPNGATLAIKRQAGRKTSAARIVLARSDSPPDPRQAGYDALALDTAAKRSSGAADGVEAAALRAGASMALKLEDYDDVALEFVCPAEGIVDILELVAASLAAPAFAQADFDRCLRDARVAERRESGDPLLRAAAELRSRLFGDHPYGLPPRGTAASLAAATREGVKGYWSESFGAERLSVVVVTDAEPRELAKRLGPAFSALPRGRSGDHGAAPSSSKPKTLPIRPWFKALSLSATPGSAVLRGEFGAPDAASPDFAAMTVALAMLDDLLQGALRGEEGLAYGAWTRLSSAAAPSASLTVYKTPDPAAAKAAVDAAIAELAGGRCLDVGDAGGSLGPLARSLEAYKARAITASYSRGASSEGMAARIARDLAAGGDGTGLFRMAGRIRAVSAGEIVRVARQRLLDGPSAWVALGDPELVLALREADFVKSP